MENKSLINDIFSVFYYAIILSFLFVVGLVLGGVVFSFIPASITSFKLISFIKNKYKRERVKIVSAWWSEFKINIKKTWWLSLLYFTLIFILICDVVFFQNQNTILANLAFYFFLVLASLSFFACSWFSYISCYYPDISLKEKLRNAIFGVGAYLIENIIMASFAALIILIVNYFVQGLLLFTGIGFIFMLQDYIYTKILEGKNIYNLLKSIRNL